MRQRFREYSGFGELLCLVVAWTVGLVAVWAEYASQSQDPRATKVAVSGDDRGTTAYYD